jgi:hypothetical protein
MPNYDLLIYRDFDSIDIELHLGTPASAIGPGEDMHVVAIGPPIHSGKDATVVLAHGSRRMERIQEVLDNL